MFERRIFTMDQDYFPTVRMREIIHYLHKHDQRYGMFNIFTSSAQRADMSILVLMTDPAVGYLPRQGYEPYDSGTQLDLWVKAPNGNASFGVVWPGMFRSTVFERNKALGSFMQVSPFTLVRGFYVEIAIRVIDHDRLDWFHPKVGE